MNKKVLSLFVLISVPLWIFFVAPKVTALKADFRYQVHVDSVDTFYNPETNTYNDPISSKSKFFYTVASIEDNQALIRNHFDVKTLQGDPIINIERLYGVDIYSKKHIAGAGDRDRNGYLFAPSRLKKNESFTYWHINYDGPADMHYVGEEILHGLKVYHYESIYEDTTIDQTKNLTHLDGVPYERGVNLDPHLQIWVEPVTGHLVKYKDNSIAYFYDKSSGERTVPWNKFSNQYKERSIIEQVALAKLYKFQYVVAYIYIPLALLVFSILFILYTYKRLKKNETEGNVVESNKNVVKQLDKNYVLGVVVVLSFVLGIVLLYRLFFAETNFLHKEEPTAGLYPDTIFLGTETWPGYIALYVAEDQGFFAEEGVKVDVKRYVSLADLSEDYSNGILQGRANITYDVIVESLNSIEHSIVLTIDVSDGADAIVSLDSSTSTSSNELRGKRFGYEKNTLSEFILDWALHIKGLHLEDVEHVSANPERSMELLVSGDIDFAVSHEPFISEFKKEHSLNILFSSEDEPGLITDVLTFHNDFIHNHPDTIDAIVRAYFKAYEFIQEQPQAAHAILAKEFSIDVDEIGEQLKLIRLVDLVENREMFKFSSESNSLFSHMRWIGKFVTQKRGLQNFFSEELIHVDFVKKLYDQIYYN